MGGSSHGDGTGADQQRDDVEQVRKVPEEVRNLVSLPETLQPWVHRGLRSVIY